MPAWRITRDYVTPASEGNDVGRIGGSLPDGKPFELTFRIRDDDGEVYYHGEADRDAYWDDEIPGSLYSALQWAEWNAGATDLQVKLDTLADLEVNSNTLAYYQGHADADGWVSIFG